MRPGAIEPDLEVKWQRLKLSHFRAAPGRHVDLAQAKEKRGLVLAKPPVIPLP
jgi:hypothetical protein